MKKIFLLAILLLMSFLDVNAQQSPHYTQYMYNMNIINPAYAGSKENLSFGLLYRKQWIQIEDAPSTFSFSGSSPVGKNVGLGLSILSDRIGPVEENNLYGDFSYTLNLGGEKRLALGLKAGVTFQKIGLNSIIYPTLPDVNDGAFRENTNNQKLNIGTGLFYYTDNYYLAFSIPSMLKTVHLDYNGRKYGTEIQHYFLTGGYVFDINEDVKLKPSTMIKMVSGAPIETDINLNVWLKDLLGFGASYRTGDAFVGMVELQATSNLRFGYAYDMPFNPLKYFTKGSHELMLRYEIGNFKTKIKSTRYF